MISFIIPAKNEENYIGDCLRSITLQETEKPFEVIVVDNNSSDKTSFIAKQACPQAIIIKEEEPGTSAARQRGAINAKGEWLVFLDSDVRLPDKQWLDRLRKKLMVPDLVAVSSHYRYCGVSALQRVLQTFGTFVFVYPWIFVINNLLRIGAHMIGGMMAIKKQKLLAAGGFGTQSQFFGDEALISRKLYPLGKIVVSPKVWVYTSGRRFKNDGLIKSVFKYVLNYFWVLFRGKPYHSQGYKEIR